MPGMSEVAQYTDRYCKAVGCSLPFLGTIINTRNLRGIPRPIYCCLKQPLQDAIWIPRPRPRPFQTLFTSLYEKCEVKEKAGNKYEITVMENSTFAPPTRPLKRSYPKRPSHFSVHLKFLRPFKLSLSETVFFYLLRLFTCGSTSWQLEDVPPLLSTYRAQSYSDSSAWVDTPKGPVGRKIAKLAQVPTHHLRMSNIISGQLLYIMLLIISPSVNDSNAISCMGKA